MMMGFLLKAACARNQTNWAVSTTCAACRCPLPFALEATA